MARVRFSPPSPLLSYSEGVRALMEATTLIPTMPWLNQLPQGDGHHVYVLPGFLTSGASTTVLRAYLDRLGYRTSSWGFGRNLGPRENLEAEIADKVIQLSTRTGRPVSLIGQSLGGVFAREVAKDIPEHVRQVITLGSPFGTTEDHSEATNPIVMRLFEMANGQSIDDIRTHFRNLQQPPPVPSTAIYSKHDGIVSWRACIEQETDLTDNIQIRASHCGMGFNPAVYYAIANRLARTTNTWSKFDRKGVLKLVYPEAVYATS